MLDRLLPKALGIFSGFMLCFGIGFLIRDEPMEAIARFIGVIALLSYRQYYLHRKEGIDE